MTNNQLPGYEIIEKALADMESVGSPCIPSLNHLLDYKGLYVTKDDIRSLRQWLKERNYKIIRVTDYLIAKRGKRIRKK
jgi:hypothetical protein